MTEEATALPAPSAGAPCPNHDRPVFVLGCERSGTTLLRAMLTAHPHLAIPYENRRFKRMTGDPSPWQRTWTRDEAVAALERVLAHPKLAIWELTGADVARELPRDDGLRYGDLIRALYQAYATRQSKPRWGDKTPRHTFELRKIARAFPEAQYVHIVRDGRDVCLSWRSVDWGSRRGARAAAALWSRWVEAATGAEAFGPERYLALRYEDLVARPEEELRRVCAFLREPFAPEMLAYFRQELLVPPHREPVHANVSRPPDRSRTQRWRDELSTADQAVFELVAGPTLLRYGYPVRRGLRHLARLRRALRRPGGRVLP